jgi:hypothetical protein
MANGLACRFWFKNARLNSSFVTAVPYFEFEDAERMSIIVGVSSLLRRELL